MPVLRFITWVGSALLALLFLADWQLPKPLPEPASDSIRPVIRITSIQQLPERIIIDTSQPTIVPPPTLFTDAAPAAPIPSETLPTPKSYASVTPPPALTKADQKKRKEVKRQAPKVAEKQVTSASAPAGSSGNPVSLAPPTRLSFADIISGQLVKNLLNLN
jgi:hypothetical protein